MKAMGRIIITQVRRIAVCFASATCLIVSTPALSQVRLIRDLNRSENPFDIEYDELTKGNNTLFFTSLGKELWSTDGTTSGSRRMKILDSLSQLTWVGTTLFFAGQDDRGWELWKSTGPGKDTKRVKDIYPGAAGSRPKELINIEGTLFFAAEDKDHGRELWKSDGTAKGTVLVKEIVPGKGSANPTHLANVNGVLYFTADDGIHGREPWKSDGSGTGTIMLKDVNTGEPGSDPESFTYLNGRTYFTASTDNTGRELWRSNGSGSGTVLLKDIKPGPASSAIGNLVTMDDALYFTADAPTGNYALWKSTGTTGGTTPLLDVTSSKSDFFFLRSVDSNLYFLASGGDEDYLWRSDGTAAGTRQVKVMSRATHPAFVNFNNSIYFSEYYWDPDIYSAFIRLNRMNPDATDVSMVWAMNYGWSSDGRKLYDSPLIKINGQLYFYGIPSDGKGFKILKTDGTSVSLVKDTFIPTFSSNPESIVTAGGTVYLRSLGYSFNYEHVFRSDGTTAGTFPLKRFDYVLDIQSFNGNAFITAVTFSQKRQLWRADGTRTGNTLIKEFDTPASAPVRVNDRLYFSNGGDLWKSNGTPAGTVRVKQFDQIHDIIASGNTCYVFVTTGTGYQELWKTDGTPAGTVRVKRVQLAPAIYLANPITVNNVLYFIGNDGSHGNELWRSDGTTAGTYMVKDLRLDDLNDYDFYSMTGFKDEVYFSARENGNQYALYRSNGTPAGTTKIINIGAIVHYIPHGNQLLFFPGGQQQIWSTDGTTAGTHAIMPLGGEPGFYEVNDVTVNDVVYFTTGTNCCGEDSDGQLWRTDGTQCGTFQIPTGLKNVSPVHSFGNLLLIGGYSSYLYGKELYSYDLASAPESPCKETLWQIAQVSDSTSLKNTPFPNPFNDEFSIRFTEEGNIEMEVFTSGGLPYEKAGDMRSGLNYQFGSPWPLGAYILRFKTPDRTWVQRVVKRR